MKQRVKDLSNLAKMKVPSGLAVDEWIESYNEILVELVVRECVSILDEDDGATHHAELLKEHFGVAK